MPHIITWLRKSGMLINESKTETCYFTKTSFQKKCLRFNKQNITTQQNIKILGFTFSHDLTWRNHIIKVCDNMKKDTHASKVIGKLLDREQLTSIARAKVLSKAWYGAPLWASGSLILK